ncbi:hypothetical protein GQ600_27596 [Phytophthora cactorum]|nr:hypothetical protein GQ600_27596 [Phytophthora cactorum]
MEAIRKAQEEAMRMLPTDHAPADDADSASSKKKHRHKHKKEHKHKKRTAKIAPRTNRRRAAGSRDRARAQRNTVPMLKTVSCKAKKCQHMR